MIFFTIFYVLIAFLFGWTSVDYFKKSRVIKKTPILTNNQKQEFGADFVLAAFLWFLLCLVAIKDVVVNLLNM